MKVQVFSKHSAHSSSSPSFLSFIRNPSCIREQALSSVTGAVSCRWDTIVLAVSSYQVLFPPLSFWVPSSHRAFISTALGSKESFDFWLWIFSVLSSSWFVKDWSVCLDSKKKIFWGSFHNPFKAFYFF